MHAAVVTSFDAPPGYVEHPDPRAHGDGEVVVEVLAAGLHPRGRRVRRPRTAVPLAEVEQAWTATAGLADRIVFVP